MLFRSRKTIAFSRVHCIKIIVLWHEEMRIFKVRKRSEKSRRYVITRIYGFFVFSEICTFVQCGVRRNNIQRIFCRCVLKFTCKKTVRQCDRKTLLYYGFPVDSCYSGKFLLLSVLFGCVLSLRFSLFRRNSATMRQLFYHAKFSKNKIRRCSMGLL